MPLRIRGSGMKEEEHQSFRPWRWDDSPSRILVIRFHAIGDVAITLPACAGLRKMLPHSRLDYLTSLPSAGLARATEIFDHVYSIEIAPTRAGRIVGALAQALESQVNRYDLVIDLQRNWMSRAVRTLSMPRAWGEFDRFSLLPAHLRTLRVFQRTGIADFTPCFDLPVRDQDLLAARLMLMDHGWDGKRSLVLLNPAGFWKTRNWPLEHYRRFAELWLDHEDAQFLFVGTDRIAAKSRVLSKRLGKAAIDLAGKTSLGEALGLLKQTTLAISEDSGLLHMAWACGVPTIALFGSSKHQWSAPPDAHVQSFHSGDLPCGACMEAECRYGDIHCLTRHTPEAVYRAATALLCRLGQGVTSR